MTTNKTTAPLTPYGEALTKEFAEDASLDEMSFKLGWSAAFERAPHIVGNQIVNMPELRPDSVVVIQNEPPSPSMTNPQPQQQGE